MQSVHSIKRKYITLALALLAISILMRIYFDTLFINKLLAEKIITLDFQLHTFFNDKIESANNKYKAISDIYVSELSMHKYLQDNDRQKLYKKFLPIYEMLKRDDPFLYVMQFSDPHNIVFLRMHKPGEFGDDGSKTRPLVKSVNNTKTTQYGFEVGHNGINYRIATPIFDKKEKNFGVLEFGLNPSFITKELTDRFNAQTVVLVKSSALANLDKNYHFQQVNDYSIIENSALFEKLLPQINFSQEHNIIESGDKTYLVHMDLDLCDCNNNVLSLIVVIQDITSYVLQNRQILYKADMINLMALIIISLIIYFVLNKYTKELHSLELYNTALFQKAKKFKDKSFKDNLTQLHNREYLDHFCKENKKLFKEQRGICAILDIDYFKNINDTYGHQTGDAVLVELARYMKQFFRESDALIRFGGEEFLIILEGIDYEKGCQKLDDFRQMIDAAKTFPDSLHVTVSIGLTQLLLNDTKEKMIKRADDMLYHAKKTGRNKTVC